MKERSRHGSLPQRTPPSRTRSTRVDPRVIVAIIAILTVIFFRVFTQTRERTRQTACPSDAEQRRLAIPVDTPDDNGARPQAPGSVDG